MKILGVFKKSKNRTRRLQPGQCSAIRWKLIAVSTYLVFAVLAARAIHIHLFPNKSASLTNIADNQYQKEIELAPYRGTIYGRKSEPLAISVRKPSLAINPRVFNPSKKERSRLARLLRVDQSRIKRLSEKKSYFAWLKRRIDNETSQKIENLNLRGLFKINESARYYPAGRAAAHLVGFVGHDDKGLIGLERQYDNDLRGQSIKVTPTRDAKKNIIFRRTAGAAPEKTGHGLHLTIDKVIQEIAEDALKKGIREAEAKRGFAIVSDPHTGALLAIANYPDFDPNNAKGSSLRNTHNYALLDLYEPGSVMKPFVIGAALDQKKIWLGQKFDGEKGVLRIGRNRIRDDHPKETLDVAGVVIHSSNICTYKIAEKLGKKKTYNSLKKFGFSTGSVNFGFPGQVVGRLPDPTGWKDIRFANIAFGQGFYTTGLELVQAMGAIANGGNLMKPILVERIESSEGMVVMNHSPQVLENPISPETAKSMRHILSRVVTDPGAGGRRAATSLYTTAGKTGTSQKVEVGVKGYSKTKRIASFLGFAPAKDPHLVVYVVVDEPGKTPYYGGLWAAPIFSEISEASLKYLNVKPDIEQDVAVLEKTQNKQL